MFIAFQSNGAAPVTGLAREREVISPSNVASFSSTGQFSRTACDICRAKNLKCRGTGDSCEGCIASSDACTYTFSSGVGPGKKRRRKVWSPSFNVDVSQQRPNLLPSRSSEDYESGVRNELSDQRSHEWNYLQDAPDVAVVTPSELTRDVTHTVNGYSKPRDLSMDWSDVSLSGDGFILCPGKHVSPLTHAATQPQSLSHSQAEPESALRSDVMSPPGSNILQIFEMPPPSKRYDPPTARTPTQRSFDQSVLLSETLDPTPSFPPEPLLLDSSGVPQDNIGSIQDKASALSHGLSSRCDCQASISQGSDELDLQRNSDIKVVLTDTLFTSVETGIDQLSKLLACNKCKVNDVNPILIVTNVSQMALSLSEIVHRLTHCQSPNSAPTVFLFGGYSVQSPRMRTSLLTGMIGLHVRSLNQLITRLERCLADQPRLLMAGARSIVTEIQQTLEAFPYGFPTNSKIYGSS